MGANYCEAWSLNGKVQENLLIQNGQGGIGRAEDCMQIKTQKEQNEFNKLY